MPAPLGLMPQNCIPPDALAFQTVRCQTALLACVKHSAALQRSCFLVILTKTFQGSGLITNDIAKDSLSSGVGLYLRRLLPGAPYSESSENDPSEECEYTEESVDEAVGEAIEVFRKKLKDCLNKASTLEATKACGDIE